MMAATLGTKKKMVVTSARIQDPAEKQQVNGNQDHSDSGGILQHVFASRCDTLMQDERK